VRDWRAGIVAASGQAGDNVIPLRHLRHRA
jgi:hypothetical protein